MNQWPHRFYWVLTTVPWGDHQDYFVIDKPADTREYTPMSGEIKDVNHPPKDIGRPIIISLRDRENKLPSIYHRIPPGCEPVYHRVESAGFDPLGRQRPGPVKFHVIGFAMIQRTPPLRVMALIDEKTGAFFAGITDNARTVQKGA